MKQFLKKIFGPLLTRLAAGASAPDKVEVHKSLTKLLRNLKERPGKRGVIIQADPAIDKFIIFSDQHKGNKDAGDDFAGNEPNYLAALDYYLDNNFNYINLGDCEELWKYKPSQVIPKNGPALTMEAKFQEAGRYYRTFGNHDITWKNKLDVQSCFKGIFSLPLPVWEGLLVKMKVGDRSLSIYLTHGHQGDKLSDNNSLSTWLVAHVWRPVQRYLAINVNTPAKDFMLRDRHNVMMYEWSSHRENMLLVTGHTHKPVFASGKYSNHENNKIDTFVAKGKNELRPTYFNTGCCCYNDGDITGIEIAAGSISLVKWHWQDNAAQRSVLEEINLVDLLKDLRN